MELFSIQKLSWTLKVVKHNIENILYLIFLKDVQKKSFEEKYKTFMDVCQKFQPVFRYFCMEKFLDPAVWFEKRLAYTRSVATSSIGKCSVPPCRWPLSQSRGDGTQGARQPGRPHLSTVLLLLRPGSQLVTHPPELLQERVLLIRGEKTGSSLFSSEYGVFPIFPQ